MRSAGQVARQFDRAYRFGLRVLLILSVSCGKPHTTLESGSVASEARSFHDRSVKSLGLLASHLRFEADGHTSSAGSLPPSSKGLEHRRAYVAIVSDSSSATATPSIPGTLAPVRDSTSQLGRVRQSS